MNKVNPSYFLILFVFAISCGNKMQSNGTYKNNKYLGTKNGAKAAAVVEKSILEYLDNSEKKTWVHTPLKNKKADSNDPQKWRPSDDLLANIYQDVLDTAKISPVAIHNAFRYFQDNRGKIMSTEVCTTESFSPKRYEALDIKKSVIRTHKNGSVDALVCWDVRHQLREDAIAIADYTNIRSNNQRMIVVDLNRDKDTVAQFVRVSHGAKSGRVADYATSFSNDVSSHKSAQGFYAGYTRYNGANGKSLRLLGLSSTNSQTYNRNIVVHAADYVKNGGRSHGCPAVEPAVLQSMFDSLEDGRFIPGWYDREVVDKDYVSLGGLLYVYDGEEIYRGGEALMASL